LLLLPFLARSLGPSGFGLIMFAQSFSLILAFLIEYGFYISGQRDLLKVFKLKKDKISKILSSVISAKLILASIFTALFFLVSFLIEKFNYDFKIVLTALALGNAYGFSMSWYFRGTGRVIFSSTIEILAKIFGLVLCIFLVKKPGDEWLYLFALLMSQSLFIFYSIAIIRYKDISIKLSLTSGLHRLKIGYPIFWGHFFGSLLAIGNPFLLGLFLPSEDVGIFSAAEKLARVSSSLIEPIKISLFPRCVGLVHQHPEEAVKLINDIVLKLLLVSAFLGILLYFFSTVLVSFIFGFRFHDSILILKILSIFPFLVVIDSVYSYFWIIPRSLEKKLVNIIFFANIFNALFLLLFVSNFGLVAMAWAMIFTQAFISFMFYRVYLDDKAARLG
jgi:PST family polysaccharide transporter